MTQLENSDELKHLLMDMISTSRRVERERLEALAEAEWIALCEMAKQHRLEPILHHHQITIGSGWLVPDTVKERWQAAYQRSAFKALELRRTLIRVSKALENDHIPYAALKGSWLINNAYSEPALRPMRDIDILVDVNNADTAFDIMRSMGFDRDDDDTLPLSYYLENTRDMPILYDRKTGVKLELHFRVTDDDKSRVDPPLSNSKELLDHRTDPASDTFGISYLSPSCGLLHLIVHAAYDHKFNNGPLILNDVARFVENADVDWDHFWQMADQGDWRNGCELIFALTRYYHAECDQALPDIMAPSIPDRVMNAASLLMLQDFHQRNILAIRTEIAVFSSLWQRLLPLWRRAFPSRHTLAPFAGLKPESGIFWLGYPIWVVVRSRQFLFNRLPSSSRRDVQHAVMVDHWLKSTTSPS